MEFEILVLLILVLLIIFQLYKFFTKKEKFNPDFEDELDAWFNFSQNIKNARFQFVKNLSPQIGENSALLKNVQNTTAGPYSLLNCYFIIRDVERSGVEEDTPEYICKGLGAGARGQLVIDIYDTRSAVLLASHSAKYVSYVKNPEAYAFEVSGPLVGTPTNKVVIAINGPSIYGGDGDFIWNYQELYGNAAIVNMQIGCVS